MDPSWVNLCRGSRGICQYLTCHQGADGTGGCKLLALRKWAWANRWAERMWSPAVGKNHPEKNIKQLWISWLSTYHWNCTHPQCSSFKCLRDYADCVSNKWRDFAPTYGPKHGQEVLNISAKYVISGYPIFMQTLNIVVLSNNSWNVQQKKPYVMGLIARSLLLSNIINICLLQKNKKYQNINWLVVYLPLWKIWFRQLGWWHSQYDGTVIKFHGSKPPTSKLLNFSGWNS